MLSIDSSIARVLKSPPNPARKPLQPLQPKNILIPTTPLQKPKPVEISQWIGDADKENLPIPAVGSIDVSLAEELQAIRRRMERLRLEREKTERLLREREMALQKEMREMEKRGREQRMLEMELDKILSLKVLRASCLRIRPVHSLREKEQERKNEEALMQEIKYEAAEMGTSPEPMLQSKIEAT